MGIRIFIGREAGADTRFESAVLFDSITEITFGKVMDGNAENDAHERAEHFLAWATEDNGVKDLRSLPAHDVCELQDEFERIEKRERAER